MTTLCIEDKLGYIEMDGKKKPVQNATVEDIEMLIRLIMADDNVEMDPVSEIVNPANEIVYTQLYSAFRELVRWRPEILAEIEDRFAEVERKYL